MNNNIIYGLKDPRTDEFRYVGKSINGIERAKSHLNHSHNPLVNEWVNELKCDNYLPDVVILEHVSHWSELMEKEKYWIGKFVNDGYDMFNIYITSDYNNNIKSYEIFLKSQIEKREKLLNIKLSNIMAKGGNINEIARLIKDRRKMLNINQEDLSIASGVGLRTIKQIETCDCNPTYKTINALLDCLGFDLFVCIKTKT